MNLGHITDNDRSEMRDKKNPPKYQEGFEIEDDGSSGFSFDDDDFFGGGDSDGDSIFGGSSSGESVFGGQPGSFGGQSNVFGGQSNVFGGQSNVFGGQSNVFGGQSNVFGGNTAFGANSSQFPGFNPSPFNGQATQGQQQGDRMDALMDASVDAAKNIGEILIELVKSFKLRTVDDLAYYGRNLTLVGLIAVPTSMFIGLVGTLTKTPSISFNGFPIHTLFGGALSASTGIALIGTAGFFLAKKALDVPNSLDFIEDEPDGDDNFTSEVESNPGGIADILFEDDFDDLLNDLEDLEDDFNISDSDEDDEDEAFNPPINIEHIDYNELVNNVSSNDIINRKRLFDIFTSAFTPKSVDFSKRQKIDPDTVEYSNFEILCTKAAARVLLCDTKDLELELASLTETLFAYELKVKRINKISGKKLDDFAREIEVYAREDEADEKVVATVVLEGDYFKITLTKGTNSIVTFGDVFKLGYCQDFFLNEKNRLPIIMGITELGEVKLADAKNFYSMLIAGKPRSGKSWYVLSVLMSIMLFNSPEEVQFIIIDPKASNIFKTIGLLPHVLGLHDDSMILKLLDEIIEIEAPRRKKLLNDHRVDSIWDLKKKGITLEVLYIVIDEYISVINKLEAEDKERKKEFDTKFQTILTQFPSLGIMLIFVPHRATGVVDKTNRTMVQFTAAVRANNDDVEDTLDIKKWDRALTLPGDIALKTSEMNKAVFVKGAALTEDDGENTLFIEAAAKIFYKLGVNIPDYSRLRICNNRDEEYIKKELCTSGNVIQYDANWAKNDLEDL